VKQPGSGDVVEILLDYFENKRTFQADRVMTIPAASYTDAKQWRAEMDVIFKRVPLMLALSCEMPNPGDYKAMDVAGLPILIARDRAGVVRAFLNVCSHRWSPLVAEGRGNCARFICPFHGWAYGADGKLLGIAERAKFGELDVAAHGLKALPCEERNGLIFACLTPGMSLDLDGYYGAMLDACAKMEMKEWTFLGAHVVEGANWKVAVDTFLEAYHFGTLHAKTLAGQPSNIVHFEGIHGPHFRNSYPTGAIGNLRQVPRSQWSQRQHECFEFLWILFPNIVVNLHARETTLFNQILPGPTPERSRNVMLFARRDAPKDQADRADIEKRIKRLHDIVREEDYAISLQIQKSLASQAHEGLLFGRNERGNQFFHEWVNWYLQGNAASPRPVM